MHRQRNQYLNCDLFTVPTQSGLKFQIGLTSKTGEFLASIESEPGVERKTRAAWASLNAQKLADDANQSGIRIKFTIKPVGEEFAVPSLAGDLTQLGDEDFQESWRSVGVQKLEASLSRNNILASRLDDLYNEFLADQRRREEKARKVELLSAIIEIDTMNLLVASAEKHEWAKVASLLHPFAPVSHLARLAVEAVRTARDIRSSTGLSGWQREQMELAVAAVKRFFENDYPAIKAEAYEEVAPTPEVIKTKATVAKAVILGVRPAASKMPSSGTLAFRVLTAMSDRPSEKDWSLNDIQSMVPAISRETVARTLSGLCGSSLLGSYRHQSTRRYYFINGVRETVAGVTA